MRIPTQNNKTMSENNLAKARCAVIILNWNGASLLRRFLPSVVRNTENSVGRVIVADNGSTDDSIAVLESEFPTVEVWKMPENYGFAGGYNRCVERASRDGYEYALLLNSDVETPAGWLSPLVDYLDSHTDVAAAQPKILSVDNTGCFEYAGAAGGYIDRNGYPYCRGRIFGTCETDRGQYDDVADIFWATGAALLVRVDTYMAVGGLDEKFFAHMEEIDLCWRILLTGKRIVAVPDSRVYHLGGGSLPASNPRKTYLNFRNNLLLLHKNLPDATRRRKLLKRRLLDTIAWLKFVLTLQFGNAAAVFRAHRHFAKMQRGYTSHPDVDLLDARNDCRHNILTSYYLKGRHLFSDLG